MDHFYGLYGIGAVTITILFQKLKKTNRITLFILGFVIGAITEYVSSFLIELIMKTKWWDYSGYILNINGRICLLYSVFWGFLTLIVIRLNVLFEKVFNKIREKVQVKFLKFIIVLLVLFLFIDCILTCYAQKQFINRMIVEKNIEVENKNEIIEEYNVTYNNNFLSNIILKLWNDEKMIKTFPNIKVEDKDGNIIYFDSYLPEIQPYYYKIFEK